MKHTPVFVILDEVDGPRLQIQQRCKECKVAISDHQIDVSQLSPPITAEHLGELLGKASAEAWQIHTGEKRPS